MPNIDLHKVLVTGAGGMVGSYIDFGIKTSRHSLDVTDLAKVRRMCQKKKPSAIIHLAAETDVQRCEREPERAYVVNGIGTYHMASVAKELGVKLIYISTSGVFDGQKKSPYTEEDEPNPQHFYGRSKHLGELAVSGTCTDYVIARVCWTFGGGPTRDKKFIAKIAEQLRTGAQEIKAADDVSGSPTFGKDLVGALKVLLGRDARGVYNLANEGVCSRYDIAKEVARVLVPTVRVIPVTSSFFRTAGVARLMNESMIARERLMRPWQEALREYLETEWKRAIS